MAFWLWVVLIRGSKATAYNVGIEESLAILDIAVRISKVLGCKHDISTWHWPQPGAVSVHYLPSAARACLDLQLAAAIAFEQAISRTARCCA